MNRTELIYRPRKYERLSWPGWLTCSGWLTHTSDHPSAVGRAQDRESSPAKDRRSTAVPHNQLVCITFKVQQKYRIPHVTCARIDGVAPSESH